MQAAVFLRLDICPESFRTKKIIKEQIYEFELTLALSTNPVIHSPALSKVAFEA